MAWEDGAERTEKPTARRRSEAREQGRIARSQDLTAAVGLLTALYLLHQFGEGMLATLLMLTRQLEEAPPLSPMGLQTWIVHCTHALGRSLGPFLGALVIISIIASMGQTGLYFSWARMQPKFSGLNPLGGIQRLFSKDNVVKFVFSLLKMTVVAAVGWWTGQAEIGAVLHIGEVEVGKILGAAATMTYKIALRMSMALLIIGLADYFWQRFQLEESLKMTKQEVKDEMKNMEGDPAIKARIRKAQFKMAMQRLRTEVPKADVIVTNPTHYSVALQYDDATMGAPRVVAKGKDHLAMRIREIAREHEIPIIERPVLARSLFATVEVGQEVPPALYRAVAELLAFVYQLTGKAASAVAAR